jgi:hypothetical protein
MNILIVGGYGTFGGRLVELLEHEERLTLVVAGRSSQRAAVYCQARGKTGAALLPTRFDRTGDVIAQLRQLRLDIVVDASGPFQAYGARRYALIEACLARRIPYLDLADGSDFVAGVAEFDTAARTAGIYVLTGMSSFPVLTAAVVRRLSADMTRVTSIRAGIAPSPYAGVGQNVIRAIASYAGQSIAMTRNGKPAKGHPFTQQMRFTVAPPGALPLRRTLFSLVDVPDLRALPVLWPDAKTVWMGAGPVPEIWHRALIGLAWLVRFRLLPSLSPLAPLMAAAVNRLRWGEHRGGMFVEVQGTRGSDSPLTRSWHLLAEGDDGPLIPSMAVAAIIRRQLDGRLPPAGARAGLCDLELEDYEREFAGRTIATGLRAPASRAGHICLPGLQRRCSVFRKLAQTFPCACNSIVLRAAKPGPAASPARVLPAASTRAAAGARGWCRSASGRSPSVWRLFSTVRVCALFFAAGAFSAFRCR